MKKSIIYLLGIAIVIPAFMSCSDFLDQNPDLRTTLDSEEKIANILVSAYISGAGSYQLVAELSSDNVCDYGITKNYNQFYQDLWAVSFGKEKIGENLNTLMDAIIKAKPAAAKGTYIKSLVLSTTMGPGVKFNGMKF